MSKISALINREIRYYLTDGDISKYGKVNLKKKKYTAVDLFAIGHGIAREMEGLLCDSLLDKNLQRKK